DFGRLVAMFAWPRNAAGQRSGPRTQFGHSQSRDRDQTPANRDGHGWFRTSETLACEVAQPPAAYCGPLPIPVVTGDQLALPDASDAVCCDPTLTRCFQASRTSAAASSCCASAAGSLGRMERHHLRPAGRTSLSAQRRSSPRWTLRSADEVSLLSRKKRSPLVADA